MARSVESVKQMARASTSAAAARAEAAGKAAATITAATTAKGTAALRGRHKARRRRATNFVLAGAVAGAAAMAAVAIAIVVSRALTRRKAVTAPVFVPASGESVREFPVDPRLEATDADLAENQPVNEDDVVVLFPEAEILAGSEADVLEQLHVEPIDEDEWR